MVNVIYDKTHPEDWSRLIDEFYTQGISEYKFWDCISINYKPVESINSSHKMIVKDAKEKGLSECIIAEQDCHFTSPNSWKYFMEKKPKEFDLYLACTYGNLQSKLVCGFHLYIISEKFYDKFLSVPHDVHIDTEMHNLKGSYHFCYPFIAIQRAGFSINHGAVVDYNYQIKANGDIYK